jgi:hypothetical protein
LSTHSLWERCIEDHVLAGNLTRTDRAVAQALARYLRRGILNPSHGQIATWAGCCRRQVKYSLAQLRHLGLVEWRPEFVPCGRRRRQVPNRYRMRPPQRVLAGRRRRRGGGGGTAAPTFQSAISSSFLPDSREQESGGLRRPAPPCGGQEAAGAVCAPELRSRPGAAQPAPVAALRLVAVPVGDALARVVAKIAAERELRRARIGPASRR